VVMRKIVARIVQRNVSQAFYRWIQSVEELKAAGAEEERKQVVVMRKIVARMVQQSLSHALDRWSSGMECVLYRMCRLYGMCTP
jgi:ABC-type transport system involved in cytochrome bd biosynthesis fused ATPase/permease subunit